MMECMREFHSSSTSRTQHYPTTTAGELDAKRAIDQGTRLAAVIETAEAGAVFNQPIPFAADFVRSARKWSGRNYS